MAPRSLLLLVLLAFVVAAADEAPPEVTTTATPHDLLPEFGLPRGLLPRAVTAFSLLDDGAFEAVLEEEEGACYLHLDSLVLHYARNISGVVRRGAIEGLTGVKLRRFHMWFDVAAVTADDHYAHFRVGSIVKKVAVSELHDVRSCRTGGLVDRVRATAKDMLRLPEPIREIEMLLTE